VKLARPKSIQRTSYDSYQEHLIYFSSLPIPFGPLLS